MDNLTRPHIYIYESKKANTSPLLPPSRHPPKTVGVDSSGRNVVFGILGWSAVQKAPLFPMKWRVQKFESKIRIFCLFCPFGLFWPFFEAWKSPKMCKKGLKMSRNGKILQQSKVLLGPGSPAPTQWLQDRSPCVIKAHKFGRPLPVYECTLSQVPATLCFFADLSRFWSFLALFCPF